MSKRKIQWDDVLKAFASIEGVVIILSAILLTIEMVKSLIN